MTGIVQRQQVSIEFNGTLPAEKRNEQREMSNYLSEMLRALSTDEGTLPIVEAKNIADNKVVHLIADPAIQGYILRYHRFGPDPSGAKDRSGCPFSPNRPLFDKVTKLPNILTAFEGENREIRGAVLDYFRKNSSYLEMIWTVIADKWVDGLLSEGSVFVCRAMNTLAARYLMEGILGFRKCEEQHVLLQLEFWNTLLAPLPSELRHVNEKNGFMGKVTGFFKDVPEIGGKLKTLWGDKSAIQELVKEIIAYGISEEGRQNFNFPAFLKDRGFSDDEIEGNVLIMMIAAQKTVSFLMVFMIYEYARDQRMQKQHREELGGMLEGSCERLRNTGIGHAYIEALRLYPPGGSTRIAGQDFVLKYGEGKEHYIRKGETIGTVPLAAGRNGAFWKDPEIFNPEREDLDSVERIVQPFGAGVHTCPGKRATEREVLVTFSSLLSKAQFRLDDEMPELISTVVLEPVRDFKVIFEKL